MNYWNKKEGLIKKRFSAMSRRTILKDLPKITFTFEEFRDWCMSNTNFHILYDNWKRLDFQKDYAPSIDRKENNLGYTISNIQLLTWKDNNLKGRNEKFSKAVVQIDKNGNYIAEYDSIKLAGEAVGSSKHIGNVCKGKRKSSQGYVWAYLGDYYGK